MKEIITINYMEWLDRLINEKEELKIRYQKLLNFIKSDKFKELDERDRELLIEQKIVMNWYINILIKRVKKHELEVWLQEMSNNGE